MNEAVSNFVDQLDDPEKALVSVIRQAILESDGEITEHIKWSAPSFCCRGDERVTFRLKVKDASDFAFDDSSGLLEWATADRAVLKLKHLDDANAKKAAARIQTRPAG